MGFGFLGISRYTYVVVYCRLASPLKQIKSSLPLATTPLLWDEVTKVSLLCVA